MKIKKQGAVSINWISDEIKANVRAIFEPRYQRSLSDEEVVGITESLAKVMEIYMKFKWRRNDYANTNA